jgi:hypothetical protein
MMNHHLAADACEDTPATAFGEGFAAVCGHFATAARRFSQVDVFTAVLAHLV